MVLLHQYIFAKIYHFYVHVFKEKEIPHWFAGIIVCILLNFILSGINYLLYYLSPSDWLDKFSEYSKYVGLASGIFAIIYVSAGDRYKRILSDVEQLDKSKRKKLGVIAIVYVLTIISFVIIAVNLSRSVHLGNM